MSARAGARKKGVARKSRQAIRSVPAAGSPSDRTAKSRRKGQTSPISPEKQVPESRSRQTAAVPAAGKGVTRPAVATQESGAALGTVNRPMPAAAPRSLETLKRATSGGVSITAHRGDGMVLLAFDLDPKLTTDLAGFAVRRFPPTGPAEYLLNRLSFTTKVTAATTPAQRTWTPSDQAPFQKFRWVDFPPDTQPGTYRYAVTAMYFSGSGLKVGPSAELDVPGIEQDAFSNFRLGFTRGYLSSQAYAEKFSNAPIRPTPKSMDFDTTPYLKQYDWLGFHARKLVFDFLDECVTNPKVEVDAFTYDLDEPDFIKALIKLGARLRIIQDNAPLHVGPAAMEPKAVAELQKAAGSKNVVLTHFERFSHDKVLIKKVDGKPVKVLTGSANFSIRGLYVQANNTMVIDDAGIAAAYEDAFTQSFNAWKQFQQSQIAKGWSPFQVAGVPPISLCFSPHIGAAASLDKVATAIQGAKSSVLFAVMQLSGAGAVMDEIKKLTSQDKIFSYGVTQQAGTLKLYKPGQTRASIADFAYLKSKVPQPFRQEWDGGPGQVIHHKFVVVDFNDSNPIVFAGSSNLSDGGETHNGDNLLAIPDRAVATAYAVEAVRLFDHYHFRDVMMTATAASPLQLQGSGATKKWWEPYYDKTNIKYQDRLLFSGAGP